MNEAARPVEYTCVLVTPIYDKRLTLEERLATFDIKRHGGEAMDVETHPENELARM